MYRTQGSKNKKKIDLYIIVLICRRTLVALLHPYTLEGNLIKVNKMLNT